MTMETEEEDVIRSGTMLNEEPDTIGMSRYFYILHVAYLK